MLNEKICLAGGGNTGYAECFLDPKFIVGLVLVPQGSQITEADAEDFGAFLQTKINDADPSERWYPVKDFVGITDNSEDVTLETYGYGGKNVTREGDYDWTLRYVDGGICLLKSLRKFNGVKKDVFFVDANGVLFGTNVSGVMQSIPLTLLHTMPWKANDGTATTNYGIRLSFRPKPVNDDLSFFDMSSQGVIFSSFQGLRNVSLVVLDPENAPITKVRVLSGCDRKNLYEEFSAELADVGVWRATTVSGGSLTITTAVLDATLQAITVTVSSGAESYFLSLADPETLDTAGISGYDSTKVKVTV
jgi:hypothetical protein